MTTRVAIDLNVRVAGNETFVGFEDVEGPIAPGAQVEVFETESSTTGSGRISRIDAERRLVYLAVDWSGLHQAHTSADHVARQDDLDWVRGPRLHAEFMALVSQVQSPAATAPVAAAGTTFCKWGVTPHLAGGSYVNRVTFMGHLANEGVIERRATTSRVEVR